MAPRRRQFLGWTLGGVAGLVLSPSSTRAAIEPSPDEWLEAIAGKKHRAFLDVSRFSVDGRPFRRAAALFNAFHEHYGIADADTGVAFGVHSSALGHLIRSEVWDELDLVDVVAAELPPADAAKLRGSRVWATTSADGVRDLRRRGVRVLACRNTIARWARDVAARRGESVDAITPRLTRGLYDGVEPVPAMIAAAVVAQQRSIPYVVVE